MNPVINIIKKWTLPVAMLCGTGLYLLFAFTPALDRAGDTLLPFFQTAVPVLLFVILFITFCRVDFKQMRLTRWHLWLSLLQVVMVAAIVVVGRYWLNQGTGLVMMECLLMCVIAPCAAAAPVITGRLGGDVTSMATFACLSNVLSALMIPAVFPLIDKGIHVEFLPAFLMILRRVIRILILPMLAAYLVKHYWHRFHRLVVKEPSLSFYMWAVSLTIVTGITVRNIVHAHTSVATLLWIALMSLAVCVVQFWMGWTGGKRWKAVLEGGQALGQKNTAFAIWISSIYLNPLSSVAPGCYILWQNLVNSYELYRHARHPKDPI